MPIKPQFLMRGLDGKPQPPQDLLDRIKRHDPRIGLFYTKAAWAITEAWKEEDPRRARIVEGDMDPRMAFDICGYLPITCSVDEAPGYIEQQLRTFTAEQYASLRHTINHWNDVEVPSQVEDRVIGEVFNDLDKSNIVSPGISTAVAVDLKSNVVPVDRMAKARAAKAANKVKSA